MANAIKILQDDHNSVRILFGQAQQVTAGRSGDEDKVALQLASMLRAHNTLEEEFIHPLLKRLNPSMADAWTGEHDTTRELLAEIERLPSGMERREVIGRLREVVKAHADNHDTSIFPFLLEKLDLVAMEDLGRAMHIRQQELLHDGVDTTGAASTARPATIHPNI